MLSVKIIGLARIQASTASSFKVREDGLQGHHARYRKNPVNAMGVFAMRNFISFISGHSTNPSLRVFKEVKMPLK